MGKKDELFWIIYPLLMEYALSEDTCERGTCLGHLSFGEFLPRSAFTTKYELSPYQCATECWLRRQRCKSFNYRRSAFSCQLCEEDSGPGGINLQPKAGSIHSNINTWKNILIGHCKEINCSWTQKCDPSRPLGASSCVPTECAFLELKLGMTIEPSNETAVGTKARRRCMSQNMERGDPITTCLEAEWSSSDFICVKQNWIQDTIYPNNTHRSEVISVATNIDLLACMQQCDDKANNCWSFFYDNHSSHCVLSSSFRRGLPQGLQLSDGLVYYTGKYQSIGLQMDSSAKRASIRSLSNRWTGLLYRQVSEHWSTDGFVC
ncbi:hypothetical protein CHS0354_012026 [Potamilus streckersoni]|uniref:Apple domain-containing protein n=1 Tax=Potamilus streckersoni TaxID=2493646 RepID=A0AAE0WGB9_9BIVA|nr:hypothetical protein CHS0354_012026 [Potamilus streckersoni]